VSRVAKTLDAAVEAFHARRLAGRYNALMLDGVVLARKTGAGALRRPVLVALGLRHDGKREVIGLSSGARRKRCRMGALPRGTVRDLVCGAGCAIRLERTCRRA
jgi:transposase-like protein